MALLYRSLRELLRFGVDLYFIDVQTTGKQNIPSDGPMIFAANHPNSIMDTVVLGTRTDRMISYMARSGLFDNPLVAFVFNRTGVIPVYKKPGEGASNEDSFRRAYEVLEEGGCIGIFPEGRNSMERQVLEIKTGTARIALGAVKRCDYELPVKIVPVGLNFENRDKFFSRVLVRFGEPIDVRKWADAHKEDERAACRDLTLAIENGIRTAATHIEGFRVLDLVKDVAEIYGRDLMATVIDERENEKRSHSSTFDELRIDSDEEWSDDPIVADIMSADEGRSIRKWLMDEVKSTTARSYEDLDEQFWMLERIALALRYFQATDPELVNRMKAKVWLYKDHLRQVRLRSDFLDRPPETLSFRKEAMKFTVYAISFGLPALYGFLHNILPWILTGAAASRAPDEAMRAFTGLLAGLVIYGGWYGLLVTLMYGASGSYLLAGVYAASLPISGFFALRYASELGRYRSRILTRTLFQTERRLIRQLQAERAELIETFDILRKQFLQAEEAGLVDSLDDGHPLKTMSEEE